MKIENERERKKERKNTIVKCGEGDGLNGIIGESKRDNLLVRTPR